MLIPLLADSYKQCHHRMYKPGTSLVYSNLTPRSSRLNTDYIIWFGMQAFMNQLRKDFSEFSNTSWNNVKEEVGSILERHIGEKDLARFKQLHEYGKIPLEFRWLPEGSKVPIRVPVLTVHNTVPEFFWFTNFIETYMSCSLWQMSTSATIASIYRKILDDYCDLTGGDKSFVDFQAHDFSFRGMSSLQSAMYSGAGHLLFFKGTDTIPAIKFIEDNYGECEAYSVPATEHSVMCSYGDMNERDCFVSLMDEFPSGILSIVSDTWDFWNVITNTIPSLKDKIMGRSGKIVVRPDSGDPVKIVCGDPDATEECVRKGAIECLWDTFGGKVNDKGFKELDPHIGLIYGDSITIDRCKQILENLKNKGFASTNIVFGVGSYTYQCNTRDTLGFAMKATAAIIDGKPVELYKNPKTDDGTKRSAKGFLSVEDGRDKFILTDSIPYEDWKNKDLNSWQSKECLRHHDTFGVHTGEYDKVWKDLREYSIMNL